MSLILTVESQPPKNEEKSTSIKIAHCRIVANEAIPFGMFGEGLLNGSAGNGANGSAFFLITDDAFDQERLR